MYHTANKHKLCLGNPESFEVQLCIDYGISGNHFLIKVQVSRISRQDMCHLDMLRDHIDQWNTPHPSHKLEMKALDTSRSSVAAPINAGMPALLC